MADSNYIAAIKGLLEELRTITIMAMASTGVDKDSDLSKSVKYIITKDGIKMEVAEYYAWVDEGHKVTRKPMVRKVPIDALIQWIKKKGLLGRSKKSGRFITFNQLAFAIQTAIYKKGIQGKVKTKGKNFAEKVANNVADYTAEELADVLALQIADELVDMFAPVAV